MTTVIGILGGMGPRATVEFEKRLLDSLSGDDQSLPKVVSINDGSIPDRSSFLLTDGEDPVPQLQHNLDMLESIGADVICIPCNTAHAPEIFGRLTVTTSELVNLPKMVMEQIKSLGLTKPMLLATEGTVSAGIYRNVILPPRQVQDAVTRVIYATKADESLKKSDIDLISSTVCFSGADCVILGCTELSIIATKLKCNPVVIDTLDVLVQNLRKGSNHGKR